jgi:hypothetical protein
LRKDTETLLTEKQAIRQWRELTDTERTQLLEAFGHYQDQLPPTCSLELKIDRFRSWLLARGIAYRHTR